MCVTPSIVSAVDLAAMIAPLFIVQWPESPFGVKNYITGIHLSIGSICMGAYGASMTYYCDHCGEVLAEGRQLAGLCESCERAVKAAKRVLDV